MGVAEGAGGAAGAGFWGAELPSGAFSGWSSRLASHSLSLCGGDGPALLGGHVKLLKRRGDQVCAVNVRHESTARRGKRGRSGTFWDWFGTGWLGKSMVARGEEKIRREPEGGLRRPLGAKWEKGMGPGWGAMTGRASLPSIPAHLALFPGWGRLGL